MKVKSIVISRDSICSRLPGVVPCLVDSWSLPKINVNCGTEIDVNTFYKYSSAVAKAAEYGLSSSLLEYDCNFEYLDNNYGLIVSDIIIPEEIASGVTDYTDFYVNIPKKISYDITTNKDSVDCNGGSIEAFAKINDEKFYNLNDKTSEVHYEGRKIISGDTEIKILTYSSLIKWYNFFKKYYKTKGRYDTATIYYENEYEVKNETDGKKYSDLDALFEARGGEPMYDWIRNTCFAYFKIPDKFADEWRTHELCYSDALKWQKWFQDRVDLYSDNCKEAVNCCDCNEFKRLGGMEMLIFLNEWIAIMKEKFESGFEHSLNSASYSIPITLTTSIDDLGEMSIFSSDYKDGVDYHNRLIETDPLFYNEESGGTVVNVPYYKDKYGNTVYDYDTYLIKNGETKGYKQNKYYENEFNRRDWYNYTDFYIRNHPEEFSTNGVTAYTYSIVNGNIIYNPPYDEEKKTFYENETVEYVKKQSVLINGSLIDVIDGYYVIPNYNNKNIARISLKTGKILPVTVDGSLKYVELNDKKYYAKKVNNNDICKGGYRVFFLEDSNCYDDGVEVLCGKYIIYNNNVFLVKGKKITLEDYENKHYTIVDGHFEYNGQTFYVIGNKLMIEKVTSNGDDMNFDFVGLTEEDIEELGWIDVKVNDYLITNDDIVKCEGNDVKFEKEKGNFVTISHKIDVYYSNIITGYTDSKLDLLRRRKINVDELGNELPGYFDLDVLSKVGLYKVYDEPCFCEDDKKTVKFAVDENVFLYGSHYNTPYNECTLDLLYKVGEVSELKRYSTDEGKYYFVGNYLNSIELYYLDEKGNHINSVFVEGEDSRPFLALYDKDGENYLENKMLYCDITYYLDISLYNDVENSKYSIIDDGTYVKYVDTMAVYKEVGNFYMGDGSYFTFNYYWLSSMLKDINLQDFNDRKLVSMSKFEFIPKLYVPKKDLSLDVVASSMDDFNGSCLDESLLSIDAKEIETTEEESPWEKHNGMMVAPVFRQEYNLGSSVSQNLDTNIYIDRGINAAFETHLKLMETHTLESLENYGNGYFKINKD